MASKPNTYMSNGRLMDRPPMTVRITRFFENIYLFLGLYFVSLFSLDPYTAAQQSKFNVTRPENRSGNRRLGRSGGSWFGGGGGGGGGGPGGGGFGPRRIGRVDDIRGPECKSCG